MLAKHRDYSFAEWVRLTPEAKFELGEDTRLAITEAFGAAHPRLRDHALATTAYFSNWGWCIAVVVPETFISVPRRFDVFPVVKGIGRGSGAAAFRSVKWVDRKRT